MTDHNRPDEDPAFESIETLMREMTSEDFMLETPPPALWDRIDAEVSPAERVAPTQPADAGVDDGVGDAIVHRLDDRRRRRLTAAMIGIAAALFLAVAGTVVVSSRSGDSPTLVATAQLSYDEGFDELGVTAAAGAELIENEDGSAQIRLVGATLPAPEGEPADLELWLIEPDSDGSISDLVSLGLVDPGRPGVFEVPDGYDPAAYFVVDISVEPTDGPPAHSGRSILRGALVAA
jgi:anti-sigma-K factor RskA